MKNKARSDMSPPTQDSTNKWFMETDSSDKISAYLVLQNHSRWLKKKVPLLGPKIAGELSRIINVGNRKNTEVTGENENRTVDIFHQLDELPLDALSAYIDTEVRALNSAQSDLSYQRSKGIRASAKAESFVREFDRFLRAYSGVVNVLTSVDAQYGGVASSTLSLLFATVKLKVQNEEAITAAMQQISDRLPDFRVYQKIYPDLSLGSMLADAYKDVILLAREATSYFQQSSISRHMQSMFNPLEFEVMEQKMRGNFNRIRTKCELLLAKRVDDLVGSLEELHKRHDTDLVKRVHSTLNLRNYRPSEMRMQLRNYRMILESIFDRDRRRASLGVIEFLETPQGRNWSGANSMVLVLYGSNETGISVADSWLSPLAIDLTQNLLNDNRRVAFDLCDDSSTLEGVLSRLIFQLLDQNPVAVSKAANWNEIESSVSLQGDDKRKGLCAALLKIVNLQSDPVFIILNRPDLCKEDSPYEYLEIMLELAEKTTAELKVMIVQRAEFWDVESDLRRTGTRGSILHAMRRDQSRL